MIIDKIVGTLFGLLNGLLGLFPAWSLPWDPSTMSATIGSGISTANGFFPVTTLGSCILSVAGLWLVLNVWRVCVWLYDLIPFKAS